MEFNGSIPLTSGFTWFGKSARGTFKHEGRTDTQESNLNGMASQEAMIVATLGGVLYGSYALG